MKNNKNSKGGIGILFFLLIRFSSSITDVVFIERFLEGILGELV